MDLDLGRQRNFLYYLLDTVDYDYCIMYTAFVLLHCSRVHVTMRGVAGQILWWWWEWWRIHSQHAAPAPDRHANHVWPYWRIIVAKPVSISPFKNIDILWVFRQVVSYPNWVRVYAYVLCVYTFPEILPHLCATSSYIDCWLHVCSLLHSTHLSFSMTSPAPPTRWTLEHCVAEKCWFKQKKGVLGLQVLLEFNQQSEGHKRHLRWASYLISGSYDKGF